MPRVLVIDDDPDVRGLLRLLLGEAGYQVLEAGGGAEGLRLFRAAPAELVFCDIFMDGVDGIETIRRLRLGHPAVRIVAMSGGSDSGWGPLPVAAKLGADVTLGKPFSQEGVLAAAAAALQAAPAR
jgi:CheY-like chemotaxis protein